MIVVPSDSELKDVDKVDITVNRAAPPDDPPPAYVSSKGSPPAESPLPLVPTQPLSPAVPPTVRPSNFLSLHRSNESIKGKFVIDPRITIPASILPPLADGETEEARRNVHLHTSNGQIDVDLWAIGGGDSKGRVEMYAKSSNGSVTLRLHAPSPARPPIRLTATSSNGSVTIHVPRSFRGPLTVRTRHGSVKVSSELEAATTTFSEASGTRRCFVGEFVDWADAPGEWRGDEVEVETSNGSVKLQYEKDAREACDGDRDAGGKGKGSSFFGKLLGL